MLKQKNLKVSTINWISIHLLNFKDADFTVEDTIKVNEEKTNEIIKKIEFEA